MSDNFILGMDAKLYYGDVLLSDSVAPDGAIVWTELDNVQDVTTNLETGEADITTRANNGWRATAATLKDGSIEFEMVWKPGDSGFEALKDAWADNSEIALMVLDQGKTTSGAQGLASNFTVTNFTRTEPLEEAQKVSVTLKPSSQSQWYEVT